MFTSPAQNLSLHDLQVRQAVAVRIGLALLAFFGAAWSLLQWTLTSVPRFMPEGTMRQFVELEAAACAVVAALGLVFAVVNGLAWITTATRIRREQHGTARKIAVSAYV